MKFDPLSFKLINLEICITHCVGLKLAESIYIMSKVSSNKTSLILLGSKNKKQNYTERDAFHFCKKSPELSNQYAIILHATT